MSDAREVKREVALSSGHDETPLHTAAPLGINGPLGLIWRGRRRLADERCGSAAAWTWGGRGGPVINFRRRLGAASHEQRAPATPRRCTAAACRRAACRVRVVGAGRTLHPVYAIRCRRPLGTSACHHRTAWRVWHLPSAMRADHQACIRQRAVASTRRVVKRARVPSSFGGADRNLGR